MKTIFLHLTPYGDGVHAVIENNVVFDVSTMEWEKRGSLGLQAEPTDIEKEMQRHFCALSAVELQKLNAYVSTLQINWQDDERNVIHINLDHTFSDLFYRHMPA